MTPSPAIYAVFVAECLHGYTCTITRLLDGTPAEYTRGHGATPGAAVSAARAALRAARKS